ncbi:hypothetical protein O7602_26830 [Micromonospora sp. WMMD1128]|uniref:hypothetical protein n=1 Tax=Micromonospora sp. WMMD1128 TaxID=3015150 RepID=UPI00248C137D|nr:hypothetical protein [Micromonospora sp. WMMD1128]WBB73258.1 hypothetical protein O7602_26830 [Micromonospora sp. WMMD1128]
MCADRGTATNLRFWADQVLRGAIEPRPAGTTPPLPGSAEPGAQDPRVDSIELADRYVVAAGLPIRDDAVRAWLDQLGVPVPVGIRTLMSAVQSAVIRAGDAGYDQAVKVLRDDDRYRAWWSSTGVQPDGPVRRHLADYLEAVGPWGVAVSAEARDQVEG